MPTWILEDDCLAPDRELRVEYKGPNPFKIYGAIGGLLRAIFDVRGKDVWEREFRWDNTSEPREFFFRFIVRKTYDMWTRVYPEIIVQGKQPSDPNKEGEVLIKISGKLQTRSPQNTVFQRNTLYQSLRWLYFRTLYNDVRRNLLEECRIKINDLARALQNSLGVAPQQVMRG